MKFRTKICMLPVSAATVFVIGVALSAVLGARLSDGLRQLREVDDPHRTQLMQVERSTEQLEQAVQAAAAEGDAEKLKEVGSIAAGGLQALGRITQLPGEEAGGRALTAAFSAYQAAAVTAVQAIIAKDTNDTEALVGKMQGSQTALKQLLAQQKTEARAAVDGRFDEASRGVRHSLLVTLGTGVLVLLVLGIVSWVIVRSVWRELGDEPEHLRDQVRRIAGGELDLQIQAARGDGSSLNAELLGMVTGLRTMIDDIRSASDSIGTAASEITMGNQDLSSRTEQTAIRLQATSCSIEHLTGTVRQTSDSARTANQLASTASDAAERGGSVMNEVVTSMHEIDTASRKIVEIISVIDGIAFQTNILALNAAVEAARAGEQGRGFAVVAAEVRTLAHRSAGAAKEIKTLIGSSSEKVESGARLVQEAGDSMQAIVSSVKRVNDIIGEITAAAIEQSTGIGNVNQTVTQLDQMTQQNAALVEQSAAAAESLREQAQSLSHTVGRFRV